MLSYTHIRYLSLLLVILYSYTLFIIIIMKLEETRNESFGFFFKTSLGSHRRSNYLELRSDYPDLCALLSDKTVSYREFWMVTVHDEDDKLVKVVFCNPYDEFIVMDTASIEEALQHLTTHVYTHIGRATIPLIYVVCGATNAYSYNHVMERCKGMFNYFGPHSQLTCHECHRRQVVMGFNCRSGYLECCFDHMPHSNTLDGMYLLPRVGSMVFLGLSQMNGGNALRMCAKYWDIGSKKSYDVFTLNAAKLGGRLPHLVELIHTQAILASELPLPLPLSTQTKPLESWLHFLAFFCSIQDDSEEDSLIDALRSLTGWSISMAAGGTFNDPKTIYLIRGPTPTSDSIFEEQPEVFCDFEELEERYTQMVNSPGYAEWVAGLDPVLRNVLTQH